jgi:hypothetical protein
MVIRAKAGIQLSLSPTASKPDPSFAGLTRESSDGDGRVKHGHDDFHAMELFSS